MRSLIAYVVMAICAVLAIIDVYASLHPPSVETTQTEPAARACDDRPLMSGTKIVCPR